MPWSVPQPFICRDCGKIFYSRTYNPHRCPDCRAVHVRKSHLANYHRRRAELMVQRHDRKQRDTAYDNVHHGKPESVYSPQCTISIKRSVGRCQFCNGVRNLINGYCDVCRANGANEGQVMNPRKIR